MRAFVTGGKLQAGDDADAASWFDAFGELTTLAFDADAHIIQRYFENPTLGIPVDKSYAATRPLTPRRNQGEIACFR